ncbi:MAG: hypothetical protein WBE48_02045 [Xanthobacteraceae bacterium]
MAKKIIIMARINEYMPRNNNKHVPFTPNEIAQTAAAAPISTCTTRRAKSF